MYMMTKTYYKTFPTRPRLYDKINGEDNREGIKVYPSPLLALRWAEGPYLAEVAPLSESREKAGDFVKVPAVQVVQTWGAWTLSESHIFARFAANQAAYAVDRFYDRIGRNNAWRTRDINTLKKYPTFGSTDQAVTAALRRFKGFLPDAVDDLAHRLNLILSYAQMAIFSPDFVVATEIAAWVALETRKFISDLEGPSEAIDNWLRDMFTMR